MVNKCVKLIVTNLVRTFTVPDILIFLTKIIGLAEASTESLLDTISVNKIYSFKLTRADVVDTIDATCLWRLFAPVVNFYFSGS